MMRVIVNVFIILGFITQSGLPGNARPTRQMDSGEIELALKKMTVLGSALYVAAHPDDENTRVIAYLANEKLVRTAYLSMTRGDGGQNLIGTEKGGLLGLIRTQELLAARRIDGGEQFFSRALDFGYSKSPEEALQFWNKEKVLADVVWVIRKFRPDVILTRFTPEFGGHGHHRASAILAEEAFYAAADSTRFPEQLQYVSTWQPKRLLWDAWRQALVRDSIDVATLPVVDVGDYNPLLGKSYLEISAESRSMHKSQGFGARGYRGSWEEFFLHTSGDPAGRDLFSGIDVSWSRVPGGENLSALFENIHEAFDPGNPSASLPELLKAHKMLNDMPAGFWVDIKRKDLQEIIRACAGIWVEAIAEDYSGTPGDSVKIASEVVNRSGHAMTLAGITLPFAASGISMDSTLENNLPRTINTVFQLPEDAAYSQPYWLKEKPAKGSFNVSDQTLIGQPESVMMPPASFRIMIDGMPFQFETPLLYRWTDPVKGELYRPFEIIPPVAVNFDETLFIFPDDNRKEITVKLTAGKANISGNVHMNTPVAFYADKTVIPFSFSEKGQESIHTIKIRPPSTPMTKTLTADVELSDRKPGRSVSRIEYDYIPIQTLSPVAEAKFVRVRIEKTGSNIAYIMGSGDNVPEALEQIGYKVTLLSDDDLENANLQAYDAIVTGIRAYNTRDRLKYANKRLLAYVKNGGTMVVQYNTAHRLVTQDLGPYPFKLSRDRVTKEDAPMEFLAFDHPIFRAPNQILQMDFQKWVQERGLYFPGEWDRKYTALLSSRDPGESAKKGALLYAAYGKGVYIYTGISFFRQLPAGVPGAYRLFVNLLSARKTPGS